MDPGTLPQLRALCGKDAWFTPEKEQENLIDNFFTQKKYFFIGTLKNF